jgi:hypothetical protein
MEKGDQDWKKLASALFALAHHDPLEFNCLEPRLKETEVGRLCSQYLLSADSQFIEQAGRLLTGSDHWYVFLGRML